MRTSTCQGRIYPQRGRQDFTPTLNLQAQATDLQHVESTKHEMILAFVWMMCSCLDFGSAPWAASAQSTAPIPKLHMELHKGTLRRPLIMEDHTRRSELKSLERRAPSTIPNHRHHQHQFEVTLETNRHQCGGQALPNRFTFCVFWEGQSVHNWTNALGVVSLTPVRVTGPHGARSARGWHLRCHGGAFGATRFFLTLLHGFLCKPDSCAGLILV